MGRRMGRARVQPWFLAVILLVALPALGPGVASGDACTDAPPAGFGGVLSGAPGTGECTVSSVANVNPTLGPFNIDRTLRITGTGRIDASHDVNDTAGLVINVCVAPAPAFATCDLIIETPTAAGGGTIDASDDAVATSPGGANEGNDSAKPITLNVSRDLMMRAGSFITAENTNSGGDGADITITVGRNVTLHNDGGSAPGATISSSKAAGGGDGTLAGDIRITAGPPPESPVGNVVIQEFSAVKANNVDDLAGEIHITAGHSITIFGDVLSQGLSTGRGQGGPIFLNTCELLVGHTGLVSSLGKDPGADLVHVEGCVVRIFGVVESTGDGHANDITNLCNTAPRAAAHVQSNRPGFDGKWAACVEVWSGTTITIDGTGLNAGEVFADTAVGGGGNSGGSWVDIFARGNISILNDNLAPFAVHANQPTGTGTANGGPSGGLIMVKSLEGMVTTAGFAIQANATQNGGGGGEVIVEASQNVAFGTAIIEARGANAGGGAQNGGRIFGRSFNGVVSGAAPGHLNADGGGGQAVPDLGVVTLQGCGTGAPGDGVTYTGASTPAATILADACGGSPTVAAYVTAAGALPLGDCLTRCGDTPGPGNGDCLKSSVNSVLDVVSGRFPANLGPDYVVKVHAPFDQQIQPIVDGAVDVNLDGYIIILVVAQDGGLLGGHTTQHVVIQNAYPDPFGLLACSVTLHALNAAQPTGHITSTASAPFPPAPATGNIFVMDLHAADSSVAGWLVDGNNRYLRNINTSDNAIGVHVVGDGNTVHNGLAEDNQGQGYLVEGDNNKLTGIKAFANQGHGVEVLGSGNLVEKADVGDRSKGNVGDGVHVEGASNVISEVDSYANLGWGIFVIGDLNQLKKNNAGEKNKPNALGGIRVGGNTNSLTENDAFANLGDGFFIIGNGNFLKGNRAGDTGKGNAGDGFHVEGSNNVLDSNRANANSGDGFDFARAAGTNNSLKANKSNETGNNGNKENGGCEYRFAESTSLDAGSNKIDNANFVGVGAPKRYAAGCYEVKP